MAAKSVLWQVSCHRERGNAQVHTHLLICFCKAHIHLCATSSCGSCEQSLDTWFVDEPYGTG